MSSTNPPTDTILVEPMANEDAKAAEEKPVKAPKEKKAKTPKEKKLKAAKGSKPPPAHPPYFQMIFEAIVALKERDDSNPYAIAKFLRKKYKFDRPPVFKKKLNDSEKSRGEKMPLGQRVGDKSDSRFCRAEMAFSDDVSETLGDNLDNGFDFVLIPLNDRKYRPSQTEEDMNGPCGPPFAGSDLVLCLA